MAIKIKKESCTGCSYCVLDCPVEAISLKIEAGSYPVINADVCTRCGRCLYICPNNVFADAELEAPPVELKEHYDEIVIGGGIGGLMAAAGLAKAGKKVLLLEQLSFLGGKYSHLNYKGYAVTTAAWTCPGPNSYIGMLCKKLGADIKWITVKDVNNIGADWIVLKDGRRFPSQAVAQETLVGGKKGMQQVFRWIADMYDPNVTYPKDMTARQYVEKFFPGNEAYVKYVETIVTYCSASQTVDTFSAMETKNAIVSGLEQLKLWGTAIGGTAAIVKGIEEAILKYGGEIATKTRVKSIDLKDGKACGVTLSDGRHITADNVIHNAGIKRFLDLVGEENLPAKYVARMKSVVPAIVAALILGTKENLLGKDHSLLHTMGWERTVNSYAPTFFDPKMAPEGHQILDVFWVMQPPYDMKHELDLVKSQLKEVFPNYDQAVEMEVPMFFTGAWTAEMAQRIGQDAEDRLDPKSPIDNLYLVGYDCIGYGYAGDIIPHGVERALYLMLNDPQYAPLQKKASDRFNKWVQAVIFRTLANLGMIPKTVR